ncbi:MAG: endonuclease III [Bacillota bacterium]
MLILEQLAAHYPEATSGLVYNNPYQLFVATVLSAQTTDEQVNRITKELFKAVPSVDKMSRMKPEDLEPYLRSCGLYRQKSRFLITASRMILKKHEGRIPDDFEELIKLPGIGRKTANVIISGAFGKPALAVDTHVFRVSKRLGLAEGKSVDVVEEQLKQVIPMKSWSKSHHQLIAHGRRVCHARKPGCTGCFLCNLCLYARERGDII